MLRADSASDAKRSCELCFSVLVKRSVLTAHPNPYLLEVLPEVQDVCVCVCVHVFVFFLSAAANVFCYKLYNSYSAFVWLRPGKGMEARLWGCIWNGRAA